MELARAAGMRTVEKVHPFLLSLTLVACGGGSGASPDAPEATPDAPPDAPEKPATTITIETTELPPVLVAVRDGTAPWKLLPPDATTFSAEIHGPYLVTVVCDDKIGDISIYQFARTPDDDTLLDAFCFESAPAGTLRQVSGEMAQPGAVALGFTFATSTTPDWTFAFSIEDGAYDLIANSTDRVVVTRGVAIGGDTTLPKIDVTQGALLAAAALTAPNATAVESVRATVSVFTPSTFAFSVFRGAPDAVKVLPDSILVATDNQRVNVSAFDGTSTRSLRRTRFKSSSPKTFMLPDRLAGAQFTVANGLVTTHWGPLPVRDVLTASMFASNEDFTIFLFQDLDIGPAFAATASQVTFDTDIPGFKPEWKVNVDKEYSRSLSASRFGNNETATSTFSEDVNVPPGIVRIDAARDARRARVLERRNRR